MQLETDRLRIRSFILDDVPAYATIVSDPEVMRYLDGPQDYAQAESYVRDCIERDQLSGVSRYVIESRANDELLGFCGFKAVATDAGEEWLDFGWRYRKSAWRQGIGIEAARAVHQFGKSVLHLNGIEARAHEDNSASLRIIELLGFRWLEDYQSPAGVFRRYVETETETDRNR